MKIALEIDLMEGHTEEEYRDFMVDLNQFLYRLVMVDSITKLELEDDAPKPQPLKTFEIQYNERRAKYVQAKTEDEAYEVAKMGGGQSMFYETEYILCREVEGLV